MRASGSCRCSWGSPWGWWAAGCLLALLLFALPASAQNENSARQRSIEASLIDSLEASAQLRQALKERNQSREDLEKAYAELALQLSTSRETAQRRIEGLMRSLDDSLTLSDGLQAEIARLTTLLAESRAESEALSKAFDDYRAEMRGQVAGLERRVRGWKTVAIAAILAALAAGAWAVAK